ncbi:MAG TPA: NAD-dependent epimerase/dehydratase family protein [Candidatus Acidoferrum sp.]|jgi:nucleoside-diphosphate-sugar epimerase|nr:NAD-dependent epimerase/dehydratase family protein [Candidatus Acidoferrum sp.]
MKRIAITGAQGFVGSMLARRFIEAGWVVTRFSHSASASDGDAVPFRLGDEIQPEIFRSRNITALVHCAYDFKPVARREIQHVNVDGSRKVLAAAAAGGVQRIAVMSTISAFEGCRSDYGRAKLQIEAAALVAGDLVVRAGLVWADGPPSGGGMFGSLARSVRGGLVPLVGGGRHPQYLVHVQDLWELLRRFCDGDLQNPGKPVVAAASKPWPMRDLLAELARRQGRRPRFWAVPWQPVWAGLRLAELAHLPVPYRSDSVVSLVYQDPKPDFESLRALGIATRDFTAS